MWCFKCNAFHDYLITQVKYLAKMKYQLTCRCVNCGGNSYDEMELCQVQFFFKKKKDETIEGETIDPNKKLN